MRDKVLALLIVSLAAGPALAQDVGSGTVDGAVRGAAKGAIMGGPHGAAVGAGVGAATGTASDLTRSDEGPRTGRSAAPNDRDDD